jgi:proline dehydrogenase
MSLLDAAIARTLPLVPKPIVGQVSKRYIAGEAMEDALAVVAALNARGMLATVDVLGEHIHRTSEADASVEEYKQALAAFAARGLQANVSVKLTAIGLQLDPAVCLRGLEEIVATAAGYGNFVRVDMEDSACTEETLSIFLQVQAKQPNVGVALQAYLRRSRDDVRRLAERRANVRLCKGIYNEPRVLAYKDREIIRRNYALLLEDLFRGGCYVGIATHDELLVWEALRLIEKHRLARDQYEFQMLLGVDESLRQILVDAGHRLRVYVPFGRHWYAYSLRRLRENPKIGGYVFKNLIRRSH